VPCPALNIAAGFQAYFDTAVRMVSNPPFDPFKNDINFLLSTWSLEEIGATGDKVRQMQMWHSCGGHSMPHW
jgi:hypothetical protein